MGSRRTMTRSLSGNERSLTGTEMSGSSRSPGCSYLSNVRPENRSTLCSVIAQLTEETQPFFETTLKSKAVSENCNVKFSCVVTGHPTPQITWYKDDTQLDRYCGLPKYEIFRNGQNHSLYIYKCTVEDAAIYQASAANTKGIVSCSGVLEVGEMNEFKIHQRYFSKLKQKAENKRREAEEKENQEPLRTISPDRAQRKRRSTVGGYLSAPSSTEDGGSEENQQDVAAEVKARLQETPVEEVKDTNGTVSPLTNGQDVKEKGSKTGTNIYDSAQKIFSALTPKTPFFKKSRNSNTAKVSSEEKKTPAASTEPKQNLENVNEVDSITTSNSREVRDRFEKTGKGECVEVTVPTQTETNTSSLVPAFTSLRRRVTNIAGKPAAKQEKEGEFKTAKENAKVQNRSPSITSLPSHSSASKLQQSQPMAMKEDTCTTPDTKVTDRDQKPGLSTDRTSEMNVPCDSRTALPQPPCQLNRDQPPQKETSSAKVKVCGPQPVLSSEATPAHAMTKRNKAPVALELQSNRHTTAAPGKTPTESAAHDRPGPSLHHGLQKAIDKMTEDRFRGSSEGRRGLFTDTQKLPLESPRAGENTPECNVSLTAQQSQLITPVKTVERTEIQLDEKVKCNEIATLTAQPASVAQNEKSEMVKAVAPLTDVSQKEKAGGVAKENDETIVDISNEDKESKRQIQTLEKTCSEGLRQAETETAHITKDPEMFSEPELNDFQKGQTPIAQIISIAELLRAQIKALEQSVTTHLPSLENAEDHTGSKSSKTFRESGGTSVKKSDKDIGTSIDKSPPQTIKATLMQIYNELLKTNELIVKEAPLSESSQLQKTLETTSLVTATCEHENRINRLNVSETVSKEVESPTKVCRQEHPKDEPEQGRDRQEKHKLTPEVKLNSETGLRVNEINAAPFNAEGKKQELKTSGWEPELELPVKSNPHQDSSRTEDIIMTVSLAPLTPETSPLLKKRDCVSPLPSATPRELASGARRKILTLKTKPEEVEPPAPAKDLNQKPAPFSASTSPRLLRHSTLLEGQTPPMEKRSPLLSRRKSPEMLSQPLTQEVANGKHEERPSDKSKNDPYKAPQVIRKIRGETFSDLSGHLKLWCQFFNVLSESTIIWHKDEVEIAKMKKSAGDETQVSLALAQASCQDSGVYGCTITNEYGTDSTDFLLSAEILTGMCLREDLGVGEEIEMTPLLFNRGVSDSSVWGNKFFGRIMLQESRLGEGFSHKTWRAKVIYGLEPVFESGNTCMIKVCNPIAYGGKGEGLLTEKNLEVVKQACKIQNLAREYCKIFSAEARAVESFRPSLEIVPVYLMYRPANTIPYATAEADLAGMYRKYSALDHTGRLAMRAESEVEQKCCALQHWIFQWTNGNMLLTKLEGVDTKITNIGLSVKSTGHQGLSVEGNPKAFEQFVIQHQCNYFCGLLGLRSLKVTESLLMPTKPKGSKSPLIQRKMGTSSSSPQTGRKASASPRTPRKMEQDARDNASKLKVADESKHKLSNIL